MIQLTPSDVDSFVSSNVAGFPIDLFEKNTGQMIGRFFFIPIVNQDNSGPVSDSNFVCYEVVRRFDTVNPLDEFIDSVSLELVGVEGWSESQSEIPFEKLVKKFILVDPIIIHSSSLSSSQFDKGAFEKLIKDVEYDPSSLLAHMNWDENTEISWSVSNIEDRWIPCPKQPNKPAVIKTDSTGFKISHIRIRPENMSADTLLGASNWLSDKSLDQEILSQGGLSFAYTHSLNEVTQESGEKQVELDVYVGISICSIEDNFSRAKGRKISVERATEIKNSQSGERRSEVIRTTSSYSSIGKSNLTSSLYLKRALSKVVYDSNTAKSASPRMGIHSKVMAPLSTWNSVSDMRKEHIIETTALAAVGKWCSMQSQEILGFEFSDGKYALSDADNLKEEELDSILKDKMVKNIPVLNYSAEDIAFRMNDAMSRIISRELKPASEKKQAETKVGQQSAQPQENQKPTSVKESVLKTVIEGLAAIRMLKNNLRNGSSLQ